METGQRGATQSKTHSCLLVLGGGVGLHQASPTCLLSFLLLSAKSFTEKSKIKTNF